MLNDKNNLSDLIRRLPQKRGTTSPEERHGEISNDSRPICDWCRHGDGCGSNDRVADDAIGDHRLGSDHEVGQSRDHHDLHRRSPFGDLGVGS